MGRILQRSVVLAGLAALALVPVATDSGGAGTNGHEPDPTPPLSVATSVPFPAIPTKATTPTTASGAVPGVPAGDAPTITVTPHTNLVGGQPVTVVGTGFTSTVVPSGGIGVGQCRAGAVGQDGCDLSNLAFPQPDASGGFTLTFRVRRTLNIGGTTLRCDDAPGTCILGGAVINDQARAAFSLLEFDPNAPRPNPVLTVTPNTNLLNRDVVRVSGTGFSTSGYLEVSQCAVGSPYCSSVVYLGEETSGVDPQGNFSVDLSVRLRARTVDGSPTDCLAVACEIRTRSYQDPDYNVWAPITFDPNQPIPPPPSITADPTTGLADRQTIRVTGANFDGNTGLWFQQCLATNDGCRYINTPVFVAPDGSFSADVTVRRQIYRYRFLDEPGPPELVDCVVAGCTLEAYTDEGFESPASIPLSFDPALPVAPPPTMTVDPSTGLAFRATVAVTGSGFTPNEFVYAEVCVGTTTYGSCRGFSGTQADSSGNVVTSVEVRRRFVDYSGTTIDCLDPGTECTVELTSDDGDRASAPISFDPHAPIPPPPTARVAPDTDLGWKQSVHVNGSGFTPNGRIIVQQCAVGLPDPFPFPFLQCAGGNYNDSRTADAHGNVETTFTARRFITSGQPDPIDCAASFGRCVVRISSGDDFDFLDGFADVPVGFDPHSPEPPGPPVTVTPHSDLTDGQVVTVSGSGFSPFAMIGMTTCLAGTRTINNCDINGAKLLNSDGTGAFSTTYPVRKVVMINGTAVDCGAAPGTCVLGVANIGDYIEFSLTSLTFGSAAEISHAPVERHAPT